MPVLMQIIEDRSALFVAVSTFISLLSLFLLAFVIWRSGRVLNKYRTLMRGMGDKNLEELLNAHLSRVKLALERVDDVELTCKKLQLMAEKSLQKVGVVRFNAFNDTGSDLSFAVALLDSRGDGVVISTIFGRDESRTYAKPVQKGGSSYHLSDEEQQALTKALGQ
ncbi:MAG: DUF4446 family protein [Bacillota bacterium]